MPGSRCCIKDCPSRSHNKLGEKVDNGVKFYRFPTWKKHLGERLEELTMRRQMAWISAVRREDIIFNKVSSSMRVCSLHFYTGKPADEMLENHPDWLPSLHLGYNDEKGTDNEKLAQLVKQHHMILIPVGHDVDTPTFLALPKRKEEEPKVMPHTVEVVLNDDDEEEEEDEQGDQEEINLLQTTDEETAEELLLDQCTFEEISCLLEDNKDLNSQLSKFELTEQFLKSDDEKVKYFTGLPSYSTFQVLLRYIVPFLPRGETQLTHFQMVLLTFIRLKLDVAMEHISALFGVQRDAANAAFQDTVSVLYARLSPLVRWPGRERLWVSMPHQFVETFGEHLTVIVDCFEVSVKISNAEASIQTHPNYKHSQTLKYLTGITPQGVISFVSRGLSGHTSDKEMVESCGLLDKLLPGDTVLAGRGFDIDESVGLMCAEVKSATLTEGRNQLDPKTVEVTKVSHIKTHTEKIIGAVCNTYRILSSRAPVGVVHPCQSDGVTFTDKVVTVCCALSNVCPSGALSLQ